MRETFDGEISDNLYLNAVTGLPKWNWFQKTLQKEILSAKRSGDGVVLMMLGLDRFKAVNETMGHKAGDLLLQETVRRIQLCLRPYDHVAYLGGDEFAIILSRTIRSDMLDLVANRLLEKLSDPFMTPFGEVMVEGSIGISVYPEDSLDYAEIIHHANTALVHARQTARSNFQYFTRAMHTHALQRLEMEVALRAALENGEFRLYYQPKIDIATRRVVGAEALVRWQKADGTLVPPNDFIPLAESTGLIVPMGKWILYEACRQNKRWLDEGLDLGAVAVNISARQFRDSDALVTTVKEVLHATGLAPNRLELEITESMMMDDVDRTISTLTEFNQMGISIAIDDFGTGYSSLAALKKLPIQLLKIDRAFVQDLKDGMSDDASIISAIISMAKNLRIKVIVEGVETKDQYLFLKSVMCHQIQGYYFSKPMPADAFQAWMMANSPVVQKIAPSLPSHGEEETSLVHQQVEQEYARALTAKIASSALLETLLEPMTLTKQIDVMLEIILAIPWLAHHYKGAVFLVNDTGDKLILTGRKNLPETLLTQCAQIPFGHCHCGRAAQKREIVFSNHVDEQHDVTFEGMQDHGHYCIPLLAQDQLLGVLTLYLKSGHKRDLADDAFLTTIAITLALAINHRRMEEILRQSGNELRRMAYHDALTGLRNRQSFDEIIGDVYKKLQKNLRRESDSYHDFAYLAMLDIDHFKKVNDTYGHLIGDEVLVTFAHLLIKTFRENDVVFRFGGEEFVVLLVDVTEEQALAALNRFREVVADYAFPQVGRVTVSLGAIEIVTEEMPNTLMEKADKALYFAKQHGRNQVGFYQHLVRDGHIVETEIESGEIDLW
ncbi:MAG: diguanylate cyclase [Magnetococcales bacterium]|nr:diguanylate cyclase [Magnetococcales bacterium]MBF0437803.1 diguanylate cyclase [Magnetococcales bacterium]